MSENPSLDGEPEKDAVQYKRQTNARNIALLRREKLILEERLKNLNEELENLSKQDG
jgi:hypothetical protein